MDFSIDFSSLSRTPTYVVYLMACQAKTVLGVCQHKFHQYQSSLALKQISAEDIPLVRRTHRQGPFQVPCPLAD